MRRLALVCAVLAVVCSLLGWRCAGELEQTLLTAQSLRRDLDEIRDHLSAPLALTENTAAQEMLSKDYTPEPEQMVASYTSPEDILFVSQSEAWDEQALKSLYEELLLNRHGEELNSLSRVTVYPQKDDFAAATHERSTQQTNLTLHFPSLPETPLFAFTRATGVISLYDGDERTTAKEMASSLSHEYGHHYTFTYMLQSSAEIAYYYTEYATLRGLNADNSYVSTANREFYNDHHESFLVEIAAEDYVTLMGSPNARTVGEYRDIRQYMNGETSDTTLARNAAPQENMKLPLAQDVPGLADYFYSFLDEPAPEFPQDRDFGLAFDRRTASYNLTSGYQTFVSYKITWDKRFGDDAIYTLISAKEGEDYMPIRTIHPGEEAAAWIGCVTQDQGTRVQIYDDGLASGTRTFLVTAILPDGRFCVSEPVTRSF